MADAPTQRLPSTVVRMTAHPRPDQAYSARSLIHGQGHPSQVSRLARPWRLESPTGRVFAVRRAQPSDLPGVMGALVRSSPRSRWQWRESRGGQVPSIAEMARWLQQPHSLVVLGAARAGAARVVGLAGLDEVTCAGAPASYAMGAEILVADPWQGYGVGRALMGHLAAAAWLLGRRDLTAASTVEDETARRLLGGVGPLTARVHPHGEHHAVRLSADTLRGLGPLRVARLG